MDFETSFPMRFWINLGRREDRRVETEARLEELGLTAERFVAVDASKTPDSRGKNPEKKGTLGKVRGYESAGRYARGDMRWR